MKLTAIASSMSDVILLSDTRVISSKGISSAQRIQKSLRDCKICSYSAFFHSNSNSRGVAILLRNDLCYNVIREYKDANENFYMLDVEINKTRYGIGAVYGPNNTSRDFYRYLRNTLDLVNGNGCSQIILGGDWNTTVDRRPVTDNIDTFCMSGLPNPKNSELLELLCFDFALVDPYRVLYPNKRDYTYSPFGNVRLNRSRLDFFVISNSLVGNISECCIADSVSCKLFDHKPVCLKLNKPTCKISTSCRLSNLFLDNELLSMSVEIAVRRAHLFSLKCDNYNRHNILLRERELGMIRDALTSYKNLTSTMCSTASRGGDLASDLNIAAMKQDVRVKLNDLSPIATLEQENKNCNASEFFVALTDEVRVASSRTQKFLGKLGRIEDIALGKQLEILKVDYPNNALLIAEIENRLKIKSDNLLREKIKDVKIFECLNAEKATPLLLNLAKKTGSGDRISNICEDNGTPFSNDQARNVYIKEFYCNLYQTDHNVQGTIEDFLGPSICNHPLVAGSKLTGLERAHLDRPLEITELDKALEEANMRSAQGINGYSYRFIARFWHFFRIPLFKCAEQGLENNTLPNFFKTAVIKLIPKKGNTTMIKKLAPYKSP
jgi:exonuclease III